MTYGSGGKRLNRVQSSDYRPSSESFHERKQNCGVSESCIREVLVAMLVGSKVAAEGAEVTPEKRPGRMMGNFDEEW